MKIKVVLFFLVTILYSMGLHPASEDSTQDNVHYKNIATKKVINLKYTLKHPATSLSIQHSLDGYVIINVPFDKSEGPFVMFRNSSLDLDLCQRPGCYNKVAKLICYGTATNYIIVTTPDHKTYRIKCEAKGLGPLDGKHPARVTINDLLKYGVPYIPHGFSQGLAPLKTGKTYAR